MNIASVFAADLDLLQSNSGTVLEYSLTIRSLVALEHLLCSLVLRNNNLLQRQKFQVLENSIIMSG